MSDNHQGGSSNDGASSAVGGSAAAHSNVGPPQPFGPPILGNRGPGFAALAAVCRFLVTLVVALRMARCLKNRTFRLDDYLILFCWVIVLVTNILECVGTYFGAGKHISNIPLADLKYATKLPLIAASFLAITLAFAKTSVGLTLLHIDISKKYSVTIILIVLVAVIGNIQLAIVIPQACTHRAGPLSSASTHPPSSAATSSSHCIPAHGVAIASYLQAVLNIITDMFFVLTPMISLRNVRLSHKDKLATNILLGFMFTATILSIAKLANEPTFIRESQDITWANIPVSMYGIGETTLCIIAACLPAIRQLLGARFPSWHLFSSRGETKKSIYARRTSASHNTARQGSMANQAMPIVGTTKMPDQLGEELVELQTRKYDEEKGMASAAVRAEDESL